MWLKIFVYLGIIYFMIKNLMDSMKKPVTTESKLAKKSTTKPGLKGNQSKLDANKNGKIDSEDFKMLKK